jgi:predicted nucleic acid-binding protein
MPFVIDASTVISWALGDEHHPGAEKALAHARADEIRVPALWWFEVRNALIVNERRGRISEPAVATFLRGLGAFRIMIKSPPANDDILALARRHRLTVYDSAYLELARRDDIPLATLDRKLAGAATAENIALLSR